MKDIYLFFSILFFLSACFEEDEKILPYPGEIITIENNIDTCQSYFNLESKKTVAFNSVNAWDMGFEASPTGGHLKINSGKELFLHKSELNTITSNFTITGNEIWEYDNPGGYLDSTAFGKWYDTSLLPYLSKGIVYIIGEKGLNGYSLYAKVQLIKADSTKYLFQYTLEKSGILYQGEAVKNDSVNFIYYNLRNHSQIIIEPPTATWDILFTTYYDLISLNNSPYIPYRVRGVFINYGVSAYYETGLKFEDIALSNIDYSKASDLQDAIGYDWKDVVIDFSGGSADYQVISGRVYIIKSLKGSFYKLRFLGYTLNGINGFPRFEYQILN